MISVNFTAQHVVTTGTSATASTTGVFKTNHYELAVGQQLSLSFPFGSVTDQSKPLQLNCNTNSVAASIDVRVNDLNIYSHLATDKTFPGVASYSIFIPAQVFRGESSNEIKVTVVSGVWSLNTVSVVEVTTIPDGTVETVTNTLLQLVQQLGPENTQLITDLGLVLDYCKNEPELHNALAQASNLTSSYASFVAGVKQLGIEIVSFSNNFQGVADRLLDNNVTVQDKVSLLRVVKATSASLVSRSQTVHDTSKSVIDISKLLIDQVTQLENNLSKQDQDAINNYNRIIQNADSEINYWYALLGSIIFAIYALSKLNEQKEQKRQAEEARAVVQARAARHAQLLPIMARINSASNNVAHTTRGFAYFANFSHDTISVLLEQYETMIATSPSLAVRAVVDRYLRLLKPGYVRIATVAQPLVNIFTNVGVAPNKTSFPEFVHTEGDYAKAKILLDNPFLLVVLVKQGSMVTQDVVNDRVRVWTDKNTGLVATVPTREVASSGGGSSFTM